LGPIYQAFGLSPSDYSDFKAHFKPGMAYMNGQVKVDGQVVMDNSWSIGRTKFSYSFNYPIDINGHIVNYYKSMDTDVLKQDLPAMVLFNNDGTVKFVVIDACGNPVSGHKIRPSVTCKNLIPHQDSVNPNKYTFTADASFGPNTTLNRVVYHFSDG